MVSCEALLQEHVRLPDSLLKGTDGVRPPDLSVQFDDNVIRGYRFGGRTEIADQRSTPSHRVSKVGGRPVLDAAKIRGRLGKGRGYQGSGRFPARFVEHHEYSRVAAAAARGPNADLVTPRFEAGRTKTVRLISPFVFTYNQRMGTVPIHFDEQRIGCQTFLGALEITAKVLVFERMKGRHIVAVVADGVEVRRANHGCGVGLRPAPPAYYRRALVGDIH